MLAIDVWIHCKRDYCSGHCFPWTWRPGTRVPVFSDTTSISPKPWNLGSLGIAQICGWCVCADSKGCAQRDGEPDSSPLLWHGIVALCLMPSPLWNGSTEACWPHSQSETEIYRQSLMCWVKTSGPWSQISPQETPSLPRSSRWILKNERPSLHTLI